MRSDKAECRVTNGSAFSILFIGAVVVTAMGCGTTQETTEEDWAANPPVSSSAQLEYRVDSLMNENRRLRQQLDAIATENRNLTARTAELETKLGDAMASARIPTTTATPPSVDVSTGYAAALSLYRKREFDSAINQFEALLAGGVRSDLEDNCHYWIGESLYGLRKYTEAIDRFKQVLSYGSSEKKDDAQLMIGNSYFAMGNRDAARGEYNKLISTYPASPFVSKAQEKLSRL
ncbi:MAG: tetratricopeptide repeat protein [Ignavibacteriae bacterium]|nr:tetratricopeptide repeat protein [Ignavibacteriota bacterium]